MALSHDGSKQETIGVNFNVELVLPYVEEEVCGVQGTLENREVKLILLKSIAFDFIGRFLQK